jgi:site-specific recombinase XerD
MHQLVVIPAPSALMTLEEQEVAATVRFALEEKSPGTRRAYASDWRAFSAWCSERGLESLPALPSTLARFLSAQATGGLKSSTIGRRAAAVADYHRMNNHESPANVEAVKATVRGIRRSIGCAPVRKSAATADVIGEMLKHCPETLTGLRDRALLSLGFAGAFRRSELVGLRVEDLTSTPDGLRVMIRKSKTDQDALGQEIGILRGVRIRPVAAVEAWLAASGITSGFIFRPILKGGRLQEKALSGHSAAGIVKAYAKRAGLDPALFAGHSLRSGLLTSGAEAGASVWKLVEISRHKSIDTLQGYIRRSDLFREHATAAFM